MPSGFSSRWRGAFVSDVAELPSPLGPLQLGVVDAKYPGVSAAVSRLLFRSIADARETRGGHLPEWLVDDIERNYIAPEKVETLWAGAGHRFVVVHDDEIVGTVHVAREHDTILTVDRVRINVSSKDYPGFKPEGFHHVVNLSVKHELRRARIGMRMIDGIVASFRQLFDGVGLWVRGDPPWHVGLVGLGFEHDPSMDIFLPAGVARTAGLPHADFNRLHACDCTTASPYRPENVARRPRDMQEKKLQYVSFTRSFDAEPALVREARRASSAASGALDPIARPGDAREVAAVLVRASAQRVPVRVRGQGHGDPARPAASGEEVVLSTERLTRILAVESDRVTVEAGVTWRALAGELQRTSKGRLPPVLTGFLPATVGGTLATGGFGKGSHRHGLQIDHVLGMTVITGDGRRVQCAPMQAGWLFDAALGGLGQMGVIADVTLALVAHPAAVHVEKSEVGGSEEALLTALEAAAASADTYHVTAWCDGRGSYGVARAALGGETRLVQYLDRAAEAPLDPVWLHVFVAREHAPAVLARLRGELQDGDALQILPVRKLRDRAGSLLVMPDVPDGALVFGVCLTRDARARERAAVEERTRALRDEVLALGARAYLAGMVPRSEAEWRARLGARYEAVLRAKRLADPSGILDPALGLGA